MATRRRTRSEVPAPTKRGGRRIEDEYIEDDFDMMDDIDIEEDEDIEDEAPKSKRRRSVRETSTKTTRTRGRGRNVEEDEDDAPRSRKRNQKEDDEPIDEFDALLADAVVLSPEDVKEDEFDEVPDGTYYATVESIEKKISKTSKLQMITTVLKIIEDVDGETDHQGRLVFKHDMLQKMDKQTGEVTAQPAKLGAVIMMMCELLGEKMHSAMTREEVEEMMEDITKNSDKEEVIVTITTSNSGFRNYKIELIEDE